MRITVLAGGTGGARFLQGVRAAAPNARVTVIANNGDDITLFGLRVCPDLDTIMYTLGGGVDAEKRWGRANETSSAKEELAAYGEEPRWFGLGDRDLATHLVRTRMLHSGLPLSAVTAHLCTRWLPSPEVRLLPSTDQPVETYLTVEDGREVHFEEYLIGLRAEPAVSRIDLRGAELARPAPGVLDAIQDADLVLLAPSNPVVSIGTILAIPGVRDALRTTSARVIGISPIIGHAPVRGIADKVLAAVGVATSAAAVAAFYGAGVLDGWLVDTSDQAVTGTVERAGIACRAVPLLMTDTTATARMVDHALALSTTSSVLRSIGRPSAENEVCGSLKVNSRHSEARPSNEKSS